MKMRPVATCKKCKHEWILKPPLPKAVQCPSCGQRERIKRPAKKQTVEIPLVQVVCLAVSAFLMLAGLIFILKH